MVCKGKKKNKPTKEPTKAATTSKQASVKPSTEKPATPEPPPAVGELSLRGNQAKNEPRKKAKRNYFAGDDRYKTMVAAGLTTIAGGGGKVPPKDDAEHEKKVWQWLENWHITESHLLQCTPAAGAKLEPDADRMAKGEAAQKRLIELEKKFGEKVLYALKKGQMKTKDNKTTMDKLPAHKETPSLDDPTYELQWW